MDNPRAHGHPGYDAGHALAQPGASDYGYLLPSGGTLYTGPGETTPVTTIDQNTLVCYDGKPGYIAADGKLWVRVQVQGSGQWASCAPRAFRS